MSENYPDGLLPVTLPDIVRYGQNARQAAQTVIRDHVNRDPMLQLLPLDETGPGQAPWEYMTIAKDPPASIEFADAAATIVRPSFPIVKEVLRTDKDTRALIKDASDHLDAGGNIIVPTTHMDVVDVAFDAKDISDFITEYSGKTPKSAIMIGKGMTEVGWDLNGNIMPTMTALQMLFHIVLESWARSENGRAADKLLPPNVMSNQNAWVVFALQKLLKEGGLILAIAPTGTTKHERDKSGAVILPPVSKRTLDIMTDENSKVLAIHTDYKDLRGGIMHNKLLDVKDAEEAKAVMTLLENMASTELPEYMKLPAFVRRYVGRTAIGL